MEGVLRVVNSNSNIISNITLYDDDGRAELCYPDIRKLIIENPLKLREDVDVIFDGVKSDIEVKCPPGVEISWD